ncbi:hypothetical protein GGR57DRAFT_504683 [Xylariaceae sp. FL1272]|nr:hypothetical protein GGR57DRAFT_504683 [Xylariaceae sp. FL1272]
MGVLLGLLGQRPQDHNMETRSNSSVSINADTLRMWNTKRVQFDDRFHVAQLSHLSPPEQRIFPEKEASADSAYCTSSQLGQPLMAALQWLDWIELSPWFDC